MPCRSAQEHVSNRPEARLNLLPEETGVCAGSWQGPRHNLPHLARSIAPQHSMRHLWLETTMPNSTAEPGPLRAEQPERPTTRNPRHTSIQGAIPSARALKREVEQPPPLHESTPGPAYSRAKHDLIRRQHGGPTRAQRPRSPIALASTPPNIAASGNRLGATQGRRSQAHGRRARRPQRTRKERAADSPGGPPRAHTEHGRRGPADGCTSGNPRTKRRHARRRLRTSAYARRSRPTKAAETGAGARGPRGKPTTTQPRPNTLYGLRAVNLPTAGNFVKHPF